MTICSVLHIVALMNELVGLFRALGDEERLRILRLLLGQPSGACVCELVDTLGIPQYQVSRQLGVLRDAGLVTGEKRGTWVYYRVRAQLPPLAEELLQAVASHPEDDAIREDRERLQRRLKLRQEGVCVVGFKPVRLRQTEANC